PFVCENGSAIYYRDANGELACELPGASYTDILKVLNELRKDGFQFRGFNDMTDTEVAAITGLSTEEAHFARQRAATEPLLWRGSDEELTAFSAALAHHGLRILQGGRFHHVMGDADKSSALSFFSARYEKEYGIKPITIALGDGENDRAMLEAADFPVIIPADKATLTIDNPAAVTASFKGPKGWNEQLLPLLEKLLKENCSG
ncbi:MAG: HAD hydrolase family protein, partial [Thalassolituus sp.]